MVFVVEGLTTNILLVGPITSHDIMLMTSHMTWLRTFRLGSP